MSKKVVAKEILDYVIKMIETDDSTYEEDLTWIEAKLTELEELQEETSE